MNRLPGVLRKTFCLKRMYEKTGSEPDDIAMDASVCRQ